MLSNLPDEVQTAIVRYITQPCKLEVDGKMLNLGLVFTKCHYYLVFTTPKSILPALTARQALPPPTAPPSDSSRMAMRTRTVIWSRMFKITVFFYPIPIRSILISISRGTPAIRTMMGSLSYRLRCMMDSFG